MWRACLFLLPFALGDSLAHFRPSGVDLCAIEGLDTVIHEGSSTVNVNTVKLPEGETRTLFFRGAGFSDTFIDYYHSLFTDAIQYESCFISYAHQDGVLASRLSKDLQDKGVRCWFAPHDLRPGTLFHRGIEDAMLFRSTKRCSCCSLSTRFRATGSHMRWKRR